MVQGEFIVFVMDNKKNVLITIPNLNTAGAEKFVVDLALNLDSNKYNVSVGVFYKSKNNYFEKKLLENNIKIVNFSDSSKLKIMKNIKNYFKDNEVDVLHTNLNTILYTMFYAKKYKIPKKLFTFHSVANRVDSGLKKKLYKYAFNKINFIPVAISDYIKSTIKEEFKLDESKIECVYNGVNIEKFTPNYELNSSQLNITNVGTLYYIKNHDLLIKAFKILIDKGYDLKLNLLGDGVRRQELEQLVSDLNLKEQVNFFGVVDNVSDYLQKSDIYCCSSLVEGLPISVLEAMACGLPIVSTKAGGVVDIVFNDVNGYICESFEPEDYASYIEKIIVDKELRLKMKNESRKFVEKLSIENCTKNYEKIYEQ